MKITKHIIGNTEWLITGHLYCKGPHRLPPGFPETELHAPELKQPVAYRLPRASLAYLARFMADNDVRYYLNGLALYPSGAMCAADDCSLAAYQPGEISGEPVVIPRELVEVMVKNKGREELELEVDAASGWIRWCNYYTPRIDGRYPDVLRVMDRPEGDAVQFNGVDRRVIKALKLKDPKYKQGSIYVPPPRGAKVKKWVEMPLWRETLEYHGVPFPRPFDTDLAQGFDLRLLARVNPGAAIVGEGKLWQELGDLRTIVMGMRT